MTKKPYELQRVSGLPVSDPELIEDLQRVVRSQGLQTIGHKEYRRLGTFDDSTITRRFGSWNAALRAAGLSISNQPDLGDDVLFENIFTLWAHFGRQPRRSELTLPPSTVSQSPYLRRFGSWSASLNAFVAFANAADPDAPFVSASRPGPLTPRDPSLRLRFKVLQRDRFTCQACGASPATQAGVALHVDHITAWSNGGPTVLENLRTLCQSCNLGKGNL